MKRIMGIFLRDLNSSLRDFILLYIIIAPILLAVGLRFFIPSVESASLQFALHRDLGKEVIEEFNRYGRVELYSSMSEIKNRVMDIDDIAGIVKDKEGHFQVILEGNESHDTKEIPHMIIKDILRTDHADISYRITDIGYSMSPVASIGSASLIITSIILGGMVIGLNIIEEKQSGTLSALKVTPMTGLEFVTGKSIIGFLLPLFQAYVILWIIGLPGINKLMILVMTLASSFIAVIFGFFTGVISSNQISGIANMKLGFLVVSASIIGALLLPQDKHIFLYWSPFYWSFTALKDIISGTVTWRQIWIYTGWILGLTLLIFLSIKKRIEKGLV